MVCESTSNPVFLHAMGVSGDTEGDIGGGGTVPVLVGGSESFQGEIRGPRSPAGRKRTSQPLGLVFLLPDLV